MDWAVTKLQSTTRMHREHKQYRMSIAAYTKLQAHMRGYRCRARYRLQLHALNWLRTAIKIRIFRKFRRAMVCLQANFRRRGHYFAYMRRRLVLRRLHLVARGMAIRMSLLKRVYAAISIQRVGRRFLIHNRFYWQRVRAVLLVQAAYRAMRWRMLHPRTVAMVRRATSTARTRHHLQRFQAYYRGNKVRRRYQAMLKLATKTKAKYKGRQLARRFRGMRHAAMLMQRCARCFLARAKARRELEAQELQEEQWVLQTLREREQLQLAQHATLRAELAKKATQILAKQVEIAHAPPNPVD